jgi:hypothetical protein
MAPNLSNICSILPGAWGIFVIDLVVRLALADERLRYLVRHWYDPTWAKLVRTLVDIGQRLADVVGQGVFGGEGVATGVDLDGAVAA